MTFTDNKPVSAMNLQLVASKPSFNIRALQKFVGCGLGFFLTIPIDDQN